MGRVEKGEGKKSWAKKFLLSQLAPTTLRLAFAMCKPLW